jgi:hypothetical protein
MRDMSRRLSSIGVWIVVTGLHIILAADKIPSEDAVIPNLHSLGVINGCTNIFRCACPVMDIAGHMSSPQPTESDLRQAKARMQHLYDLGVRTLISFQHQAPPSATETNTERIAVALEKLAAKEIGLAYVAYPMSNKGTNSLEDMTDQAVLKWLETVTADILKNAKTGGVAFHCKSGKDRTGIVAGYLRIKYQHWTADEAIAEMRGCGHVTKNFSRNGGVSSWHEDHLRAIAATLNSSSQPKQ